MDENIRAFLRVLDANDNSTGGGTASAIAGAMGAALVAMVARLSIGKDGMKQDSYYHPIIDEAEALSKELFEGGREDAEAFDGIRQAYRWPKESVQEKTERSQAIQKAFIHATEVPLANAKMCARSLELAEKLIHRSNPNAVSDLICGQYLARAGTRGCLENVQINLSMIKDQEDQKRLSEEADNLLLSLETTLGNKKTV